MGDPSFSELLAAGEAAGETVRYHISRGWMQGRTTYGGLSTALALDAARRTVQELPPLRSATVSFIGPAGGEVSARTRVLRRGRAVTFVESEVEKDGRIATRCVFAFGAERPSALEQCFVPAPEVPPPESCADYIDRDLAPAFTRHFESRLARGGRPGSGSADHQHLIWVRHRDPDARGILGLLALADMPPPAIVPMMSSLAPVSSMTWLVNVIETDPETSDWWLLSTRAESVGGGYSSQDMLIWNQAGALVVTGRQSVAVFA